MCRLRQRSPACFAHVLVSKYVDRLLLYRQSQILARMGLDLHRAVLADWVGKAAFHLKPVWSCPRLTGHSGGCGDELA
ncbi:IS66 family transposase [Paradonghicola geojensis]|nr:IS66 family transposase [Marivivens geojensis]